jgi:hypothetical protein
MIGPPGSVRTSILSCLCSLIICGNVSGQSGRSECAPNGPNFSGIYSLVSARGDLSGIAPLRLQIIQTGKDFTVKEVSSHSRINEYRFPFSAEFVNEDRSVRVKACFDWSNRVFTERAIDDPKGYYRQIDTFSELGNDNIRLCREAFWLGATGKQSKSGCAVYGRRGSSR